MTSRTPRQLKLAPRLLTGWSEANHQTRNRRAKQNRPLLQHPASRAAAGSRNETFDSTLRDVSDIDGGVGFEAASIGFAIFCSTTHDCGQ